MTQPNTITKVVGLTGPAFEQHYAVKDVVQMWGVSPRTVIRRFKDEPGVLRLGGSGTRTKRPRVVLRIPESVLVRVHSRLKRSH
jgi:hypothetical protein